MGSIRYIGSKTRIVREILDLAGGPQGESRFVDLFSGTGAVTRAAAQLGWPILASDHLVCAATLTAAQIMPSSKVKFEHFGGYSKALEQLSNSLPVEGFISRQYSPLSKTHAGVERRYFTVENASRIDGIRDTIRRWETEGAISENEKRLLTADLMEASNRVANIAGTYGCFLSKWTSSSQVPLHLIPRILLRREVPFEVTVGDVFDAQCSEDDLVYLDPPYTKRQYSSYYHILETLAVGDEPQVEGVCGLRPWRHLSSPFCYKQRALEAMFRLVRKLPARRILISYSSQGHINVPLMVAGLQEMGTAVAHELKVIGKYRPNVAASNRGECVVEYLIEFCRATESKDSASEPVSCAQTLPRNIQRGFKS